MSMISPGLYLQELSYPQFQQALGKTKVCMLGGATKGPLNTPTLCASVGQLVQTFGPPVLNDLGLQSAIPYLSQGYRLIYTRIAHSDNATASVPVSGTTGGSAAVKASGTIQFNTSTQPNDADTITIGNGTNTFVFEFDGNNSLTNPAHIGVTIGGTAAATMLNLVNAINISGAATALNVTGGVPLCSLTAITAGTVGNVPILEGHGSLSSGNASSTAVTGMSGGAAAIAGTSQVVIDFFANSPGTWGNSIQVTVTAPSAVVSAPGANFDVAVSIPSGIGSATYVQVENFTNLSLTSSSTRFIDTALASGIGGQFGPSNYVTSTTLLTGTPNAGTYTLGTGGGTVGNDGIANLTAADYIGTVNGNIATGIYAVRNAETVAYSVLAIPGMTNYSVIVAMVANAVYRQDHLVLIDPPIGLNYTQIIQWVNGQMPAGVANPPTAALDYEYASISWPWCQAYDSFNNVKIWLPPSAATATIMAQSDGAGGPWLAAAGPNRGVFTLGLQLETSPDQPTRDSLYASNVNSFVLFPEGIERYGNITLQRNATLLQGEAARRAIIYATQLIAGVFHYLVMEPNNGNTQKQATVLASTALASMLSANGLASASITCNSSNNPPGQKTLTADLLLQPVDISEQVLLRFTAVPNGAVVTITPTTSS